MDKKYVRNYAAAGVPFLLAYGIPALLIACVIGGIGVFAVLVRRAIQKRGRQESGKPEDTPESK